MLKLLLSTLIIAIAFASGQISEQIVIKNVDRTIDLSSQLVKIVATITLENTGKTEVSTIHLALEQDTVDHLSYISLRDTDGNELRLVSANADQKILYKFTPSKPLGAGQTITYKLETILTKALEPYPNEITQKSKQFIRYSGNTYFYAPYRTLKQSTVVTLNTRNVENYTKLKPVSQTDSQITYGPYTNTPAYSIDKLSVHYENNAPFLTVTRLERVIEVSHWGNIAVEENIEIVHTGAKLKGPFSRYDYQRETASSHHSIKSYKTILPVTAYNIYYRDSNGNISTSQVRTKKDYIELELRPRFPLFGGWKSSYTLGYNIPSYQYLFKKSNNDFVLNLHLIDHIFDDMHVEESETSILLPVGVTDVKVNTPYQVKRLNDGVAYKYLDNLGRVVVKLSKQNLVEQHIQDLNITYKWSSTLLIHEPILISLALFLLFAFVIFYVRLDFSINKNNALSANKKE